MNLQKSTLLLSSILILLACGMPAHAWDNGQDAIHVLGQPDFVTASSGTTATTFCTPRDVALDVAHNKLYVADKNNHRVLRFACPITGNQPAAELVFGQPDFVSFPASSGAGRNTIKRPYSITVDSEGRLWVASGDNRVVWFNDAHLITTNQPDADGVLGQPDFTSNTAGVTQDRMDNPMGIDIDSNGTLYVSGAENNRVLRFDNAALKANGADADGVLGQPDFVSNTAAIGPASMHRPVGVRAFGTTLFVGDRSNGRVLRFDHAAAKADGADADGVIGQADFTTNAGTITRNTLQAAGKMAIDGSGRLYIADGFTANRVMIFDDILAKADGADADSVLGQPDFTTSGSGLWPSRLDMDSHGGGLVIDSSNNTLFVVDDNNNRVMVFKDTLSGPELNLRMEASYLPGGTPLDFGDAVTDLSLTIENPGNADLTFSGFPIVTISGTDAGMFTVTKQPAATVAPGGSTTVTLGFRPTRQGPLTATMTLASNDADEGTFTLTLNGNVTSEENLWTGDGDSGHCFIATSSRPGH